MSKENPVCYPEPEERMDKVYFGCGPMGRQINKSSLSGPTLFSVTCEHLVCHPGHHFPACAAPGGDGDPEISVKEGRKAGGYKRAAAVVLEQSECPS